MRHRLAPALAVTALFTLALTVVAIDAAVAVAPSGHAPTNAPVPGPLSPPDPAVLRQDGDNDWTGDGCPMGAGSWYPDVVYACTPPGSSTCRPRPASPTTSSSTGSTALSSPT